MIKIKQQKIILFFLGIIFLSSCYDEKRIAYFQKAAPNDPDTIFVAKPYVNKIQSGDIVDIYVNSLSTDASSFFNPYTPSPSTSGGSTSSSSSGSSTGATSSPGVVTAPALSQASAPGFLVDDSGIINYPLIGDIKLGGLTTVQARDTMKKLLNSYLKYPTVNVRILNFKISILGEVAKPSVYVVPNEQITLPEALSIAGDLTIFARRDNIQIVRNINGKKEFGIVNLNSRDVFNSPYYYLHANDLVYVQPGKAKAEANDHTYILIPSIVSLISVIVLFLKK